MDKEYAQWIAELAQRYRSSQLIGNRQQDAEDFKSPILQQEAEVFQVIFNIPWTQYNAMMACSRSQIVTLDKKGRGSNVKYKPFVFTELGVAMLSSVLKSETAIQANIGIMRAFSQVRQYLMAASTVSAEVKELRAKVDLLAMQQEENLGAVNDLSEDVRKDIDNLYLAIGELSSRIEEKKREPRRKIGFQQNMED